MSSLTQKRKSLKAPVHKNLAKVSTYDQVSGLLIALLVVVGCGVLVLFLIYLTTRTWKTQVAVPVILEPASGRADHALGVAQDLETPGLDELEIEVEPQIEASFEAITEAISTQQASLESVEGVTSPSERGEGLGDYRPLGPEGIGPDVIPRWERWQIEFAATDLITYAKQLDFFGIELATAGGGANRIEYAAKFASGRPTSRTAVGDHEERLYFTWKSGSLREADLDLLAKAGVITQGKIPLQFYPAETENLLAYVEQQFMEGRPLETIKKTVFGVRPKDGGYEFYVIRQLYRDAR